eukprot:164834-Rhodomonas_salina.2
MRTRTAEASVCVGHASVRVDHAARLQYVLTRRRHVWLRTIEYDCPCFSMRRCLSFSMDCPLFKCTFHSSVSFGGASACAVGEDSVGVD